MLPLTHIELDRSIQCRAQIDIERVREYASAMAAGEKFPPVDVFGTEARCWIGDGWHRVLAAKELGAPKISAKVHRGGRVDALKHALGANDLHGIRRSTADKQHSIQIALREFPRLSDGALAKLCRVDPKTVAAHRPPTREIPELIRIGLDGKQRPATRPRQELQPEPRRTEDKSKWVVLPGTPTNPPSRGMHMAFVAINCLKEIEPDDTERRQALDHVRKWIDEHED